MSKLSSILVFVFLVCLSNCSVTSDQVEACKRACEPRAVQTITYDRCVCMREFRILGGVAKDNVTTK